MHEDRLRAVETEMILRFDNRNGWTLSEDGAPNVIHYGPTWSLTEIAKWAAANDVKIEKATSVK